MIKKNVRCPILFCCAMMIKKVNNETFRKTFLYNSYQLNNP